MTEIKFDIGDNEIRVLGPKSEKGMPTKNDNGQNRGNRNNIWKWILAIAIAIIIGALFLYLNNRQKNYTIINVSAPTDSIESVSTMQLQEQKRNAYTIETADTVNDIPLRIYTPTGGVVELIVGSFPEKTNHILLAAHAADIRADNGKIAGAFVCRGEIVSRGYPKYGFCAIIGDTITIGKNKETPLFERVIEQEGYFFRQFSLVHNGEIGEKTPKGKSIRRALCLLNDTMTVIETVERESFSDFTQALIDMGATEAISLGGNIPISYVKHEDGTIINNEIESKDSLKQNTFIIWHN